MSVMERTGFGEKWRWWIWFCISMVQMFVLVNGTQAGYFQTFRGLQQGNPLSPLLFILAMEALSRLLSWVVQGSLLAGFSVGDGVRVSHLLYADDALILCGADSEQLGHLRCVMLCFEVVSV